MPFKGLPVERFERLDDLGAIQEPVKVHQHQQRIGVVEVHLQRRVDAILHLIFVCVLRLFYTLVDVLPLQLIDKQWNTTF